MTRWALDLGSAHTLLARWNEADGHAELVALPAICDPPAGLEPAIGRAIVPSCLHAEPVPAWRDQLERWVPWGPKARRGWIGREATDRNAHQRQQAFATDFKRALDRQHGPLARVGDAPLHARDVAARFLRELLTEVRRTTGERVQHLTVSLPVHASQRHRATLASILRDLGVTELHFIDEPVAAALGYRIPLDTTQQLLIVDIGAATLDVAWVRVDARGAREGSTHLLSKAGRSLGGQDVDRWLAADVCARAGVSWPSDPFWRRQLLEEARRVKELCDAHAPVPFLVAPPGVSTVRRPAQPSVTLEDLRHVITRHGLFDALDACLSELDAPQEGSLDNVDGVLLVGGSTQLPGLLDHLRARFTCPVSGWRPYDAVVRGAAHHAGGRRLATDLVPHDYALLVHDPNTGSAQHDVIIPRGCAYPSDAASWTGTLVPSCAHGAPEDSFKLDIYELRPDGPRPCRPMDSPLGGRLRPPHMPGDTSARLEVRVWLDAEGWLRTSMMDLHTGRRLLEAAPVAQVP